MHEEGVSSGVSLLVDFVWFVAGTEGAEDVQSGVATGPLFRVGGVVLVFELRGLVVLKAVFGEAD